MIIKIYNKIEDLEFYHIFSLGLLFRIAIILFLTFFPFLYPNQELSGFNVSGFYGPFTFQDNDLNFFVKFGQTSALEDKFQFSQYFQNYINVLTFRFDLISDRYPGPLFPLLLKITNYSYENPYVLSVVILSSEISAFYLWTKFFIKRFSKSVSLILAFSPIPMYWFIIHSTDIIFYLLSSIILINFNKLIKKQNFTVLLVLLIIGLSIRPTGIAIIFAVLIYHIINGNVFGKKNLVILFSLFFFSLFYYSPYFLFEVNVIQNYVFIKKEWLLTINNFLIYPFNIITIYIIKFFYLFGFIPSSSGSAMIYLIRCFLGILFLFGYLLSFRNSKGFELLYINSIIISIVFFLYPTHRYIMPICPILLALTVHFVIKKLTLNR